MLQAFGKPFGYLLRWHLPNLREWWYRDISEFSIEECGEYTTFDLTHPANRRFFLPRLVMLHWSTRRRGSLEIHEPALARGIIESLSSDSVFFDIGSHVGYFTGIAASHGADVHAFDISRESISALESHPTVSVGDVKANRRAVADTHDDSVSFGRAEKSGSNSIFADGAKSVPTVSIDGYCREVGLTPTAIKIDVEGAEQLVLNGATDTLSNTRLKSLFVEVHPSFLSAAQHDAIVDIIEEAGFTLGVLPSRNADPGKMPPVSQNRPYIIEATRQ